MLPVIRDTENVGTENTGPNVTWAKNARLKMWCMAKLTAKGCHSAESKADRGTAEVQMLPITQQT